MKAKDDKVLHLAISLGTATIKSIAKAFLGPTGEVISEFADVFGNYSSDWTDAREAGRVLESCVDIAARQLRNTIKSYESVLPDNEIAAAVIAVESVWEKSQVDKARIIQSSFDGETLYVSLERQRVAAFVAAALSAKAERLFEILLRQTCLCAVEVARGLPSTNTDVLVEILRNQAQLRIQLAGAAMRSRGRHSHLTDWQEIYRGLLVNKLDRMELFGVNLASDTHRRYRLDIAFVSLAAARESSISNRVAPVPASIDKILENQKRTILVGDAGSGKTTLLRWLAVTSARNSFEGRLESWNQLMPFYVPLRMYPDGDMPSSRQLMEYITKSLHDDDDDNENTIRQLLNSGKALLLLDGLDELRAGRPRNNAYEWLEDELLAQYPECTYVVSARPTGLVKERPLPGFQRAVVQPMQLANVRLFVERWHQAIAEREPATPIDSIRHDERAVRSAIESDRHLRLLATNPLMCAILCALNREMQRNLPRERGEIYAKALDMLLGQRDQYRGVKSSITIGHEEQRVLLEEFALWLLREGETHCSRERAVSLVERQLPRMSVPHSASEILQYLLERSGLLREPIEGSIDFVHRTFQEYLASRAAIGKDEPGFLLSRATDDQWQEVIVFAVGCGTEGQRNKLVGGLLRRAQQTPDDLRLSLLTISTLQESRVLDPSLREGVERLARELIPPPTVEVARRLAFLGPLAVDAVSSRLPSNPLTAATSVHLLSLIGLDSCMTLIAKIASLGFDLDSELLQAWSHFDYRTYSEQVLRTLYKSHEATIDDPQMLPYVDKLLTVESLEIRLPSRATLTSLSPMPPRLRAVFVRVAPDLKLAGIEKWVDLRQITVFVEPGGDISPVAQLVKLQHITVIANFDWFSFNANLTQHLGSLKTVKIETGFRPITVNLLEQGKHSFVLSVPPATVIIRPDDPGRDFIEVRRF